MRKNIFLLLLLALSASAFAVGDKEAGKTQAQAMCAGCHGKDGVARNPTWPSLADQPEKYLVQQLQDYQSGKRRSPMMQGVAKRLSAQDMQDVAAYFASLPAPKPGDSSEHQAEYDAGKALYDNGQMANGIQPCAACHGPKGAGIPPAGFPRLAGQNAHYTEAQLKLYRTAGQGKNVPPSQQRSNDANKVMQKLATNLTDAQIHALALYIQDMQ